MGTKNLVTPKDFRVFRNEDKSPYVSRPQFLSTFRAPEKPKVEKSFYERWFKLPEGWQEQRRIEKEQDTSMFSLPRRAVEGFVEGTVDAFKKVKTTAQNQIQKGANLEVLERQTKYFRPDTRIGIEHQRKLDIANQEFNQAKQEGYAAVTTAAIDTTFKVVFPYVALGFEALPEDVLETISIPARTITNKGYEFVDRMPESDTKNLLIGIKPAIETAINVAIFHGVAKGAKFGAEKYINPRGEATVNRFFSYADKYKEMPVEAQGQFNSIVNKNFAEYRTTGIRPTVTDKFGVWKSFEKTIKEIDADPIIRNSMRGRIQYGEQTLIQSLVGAKPDFQVMPKMPPSVVLGGGLFPAFPGDVKHIFYKPQKKAVQPIDIVGKQDPLVVEARKFKTAEEFVKAQPKVFHGTTQKFEDFDFELLGKSSGETPVFDLKGTWFVDNKTVAKGYAGDKGFIKESVLDTSNFHRIDAKGKTLNDFRDEIWEAKKFVSENKKDGLVIDNLIDNFDFSKGDVGNHIFVVNKNQIKTKQQLTDIFNKAKKGKPKEVQSLGKEATKFKTADEIKIEGKTLKEHIDRLNEELNAPGFKNREGLKKEIEVQKGLFAQAEKAQKNPKYSAIVDTGQGTSVYYYIQKALPVDDYTIFRGGGSRFVETTKNIDKIRISDHINQSRLSSSGPPVPDNKNFTSFKDAEKYLEKYNLKFAKGNKLKLEQVKTKEPLTDIFNKSRDIVDVDTRAIKKSGARKDLTTGEISEKAGITKQLEATVPDKDRLVQKVSSKETVAQNKVKVHNGTQDIQEVKGTLPTKDVETINEVPEKEQKLLLKTEQELKQIGKIDELDELSTRKIKQTKEAQDWAKYAEDNLNDKDIHPALLQRHATMTAERVAEFLDGGIGGRAYREMIKPVYDSAVIIKKEGVKIKEEVEKFGVIEGSTDDVNASLFAQKKINTASDKSEGLAKYTRNKYDEFLERLNKTRKKLGVEPIPKRADYITHLNELNVLSELFGGIDRITVKKRISEMKSELLDQHPDWTEARAFDRAKREVEGLTGISQYVDARQPVFKFAKKRLGDWEANPSVLRSLNSYSDSALRYIYQAENVAKNKAYKDFLPANSREFMRLWNSEQVAGRVPPSTMSPTTKRAVSAIRGTIGANTILGNLGTTFMQLTSFPQVVAFAGARNTMGGVVKRIYSYLSNGTGMYRFSRTNALRSLETDIGLGNSILDESLRSLGKLKGMRDPSAKSRQAIHFGRRLAMTIMETADQFTVGATFEAFYSKAIKDGVDPQEAMDYADIMTGKTQANYFREALPLFLNTIEGKTLGQFGTYGMNQWEMFIKDFGKEFKYNAKSPKSVKSFFRQFIKFLIGAYLVDSVSEKIFGRQPFDVKDLVDEVILFAKGESTIGQVGEQAKQTVISYVPFLSSVKFGSLPPVIEFGYDIIQATLGTGSDSEKSFDNLKSKWGFNVLLPFGGNQLRKTLQGVESVTDLDLPLAKDVTKTSSGKVKYEVEGKIEKIKAMIFGGYATTESREFYEARDRGVVGKANLKDELIENGRSDKSMRMFKKLQDDGVYSKQTKEYTIYKSLKKDGDTKPKENSNLSGDFQELPKDEQIRRINILKGKGVDMLQIRKLLLGR